MFTRGSSQEQDGAEKSQQESCRRALLSRLLDAVKQCQSHFGRKKELAVDGDSRVDCLLAQLEAVLHHGLRTALTPMSTIRHVTKMVSTLNLDVEPELCLWQCVRQVLSEAEVVRFLQLRRVTTDGGRARAWLRAALNERCLERHLLCLITNAQLLEQFYDDWAFIRDAELVETLPQVAKGLSSIIFALNVDKEELNSARAVPSETTELLAEARRAPQPIMAVGGLGSRSRERRAKPLVNVVTFDEGSRQFSETEGQMKVLGRARGEGVLLDSLVDGWNRRGGEAGDTDSVDYSVDSDDTFASAVAPPDTPLSPADGAAFVFADGPQMQANGGVEATIADSSALIAELMLESDEVVGGFLRRVDGDDDADTASAASSSKLSAENAAISLPQINYERSISSLSDAESSGVQSRVETQQECVEALRLKVDRLTEQNGSLVASYEAKLDKTNKELEQTRSQLRSYIDAVRSLKDDGETDEGDANEQVANYEQKLIQVAQMHAELVEFNDYLMRRLKRKRAQVSRLSSELVELRGFGAMDDSDDGESESAAGSTARPVVNIWIPTAFLSGKGANIYHIYQLYVRVRDTEWNVYRRYSDFLAFAQTMKKQDAHTAQFQFPPKKKVGRKEKRFVEERRKLLEHYIRGVVNYAVFKFPEFSAVPINKETLCKHLPFLDETQSLS